MNLFFIVFPGLREHPLCRRVRILPVSYLTAQPGCGPRGPVTYVEHRPPRGSVGPAAEDGWDAETQYVIYHFIFAFYNAVIN